MSNYGGGYGQQGGGYGGAGAGAGAGGYGGAQGGGNRYGGNANPYAQQGRNPYDQRDNEYGQQPAQPAGNPYAQQQQNPYAQQQQPNRYAQQPQQSNPYAQQSGGYTAGNDMEMGDMNGSGNPQSQQYQILDEVRDVDQGINSIEKNLDELRRMHKSQDKTDSNPNSPANRRVDALNAETMTLYRNFTKRIQKIKGMPGAGEPQNAPNVGRIERKLKDAIQKYQQLEKEHRNAITEDMTRQWMVANNSNDYSAARQAVGDGTNTQIFSQALLNSDRRGESQSALRNVQSRHEEIQKIERQIIELAQLFEEMNTMVVQQEPTVQQIDMQAENVHQDVTNANVQLTGAVDKARAARKKKWICLGIAVLIVIVIAVILAIVFGVVLPQRNNATNNNGGN